MTAGGQEDGAPRARQVPSQGPEGSTAPGQAPGPTGAEGPARCSGCRSDGLTRLPMVLADGTDVTFVSCPACEHREWLQRRDDGGWDTLPIDSVLQRSARRR